MRALRVLVTACRAPGTAALVRALRQNGERGIDIVGCDESEHSVAVQLCDRFQRVPPSTSPLFASAALELCRRERIDAVLPQTSADALAIAVSRSEFAENGVAPLVSSADGIRTASDGVACYERLADAGVRCPSWRRVRGGRELARAAIELGYPFDALTLQRPTALGLRQLCVLDATADPAAQLLEGDGASRAMRIEEVASLLPEVGGEELIVTELADGDRRMVGGLAAGGRLLLGVPTARHPVGSDLVYVETLADETLPEVAGRVAAAFHVDHFFDVELAGDLVVAAALRVSTAISQEDLNLPYLGVKHALGEIGDEELAALAHRIRPSRRALRHTDQLEWDDPA